MRENTKDLKVIICRQPKSDYRGEVSVDIIRKPHWSNIAGGIQSRMNNFYLCGYIPYSVAVETVACSGLHDFGNNEAKIVICKSHNKGKYAEGYAYLAALAGRKSLTSPANSEKAKPCTKKILELLESQSLTRKELREQLLDLGYRAVTYQNAVRNLYRQGKIIIKNVRSTAHQKDVIDKADKKSHS